MSIDARLADQVRARLVSDYKMRSGGTDGKWLRGGRCPKCEKKELFAAAESPVLVMCGRKDKCGWEEEVRTLYPDLFEDWSTRTKDDPNPTAAADRPVMVLCGRKDRCGWEEEVRTLYPDLYEDWSTRTKDDPNPTAAADGYLSHNRGLDLQYLRGAYTQEWFQDRKQGIGSATVRFPLPGGSWWERLIDQPDRFDRKAHFAPGGKVGGHAWLQPGRTVADYAAADEIWLVEGIFDAIALEQGDFRAARDPDHPVHRATAATDDAPAGVGAPVENLLSASIMASGFYPEHFLRDLRLAIAAGPTPAKAPTLVFALDLGAAGTEYTRRWVAQARREGWNAQAAQVRLEDDPGAILDWNDLLKRDRLGHAQRQSYRFHGAVLVAADEREKAFLLWRERKWKSFHFVFGQRTWWATISDDKIASRIEAGFKAQPEISIADMSVKEEFAARETMGVELIANCTFRALYFERNEVSDESRYWMQVDRPGDYASVKASFPGPALAGSGEFKKRLISVASGAIWTGEQHQLDRIAQRQLPVRDVTSIEFTGYCREHEVYVLGDLAIAKGKVYRPNDDGYFDVGRTAIKLRTAERLLDRLAYDPEKLGTDWMPDFWTAWGPRGMVVLTFFALSVYAEQVRAAQQSLGFLEATGTPGSGKSTLTEFLWKLFGRAGYEGFDPAKATQAGVARELAKAANMPVVFIEGDRREEVTHSKKFDWDETKTLYNGRATRTRGVKSDGLETYSPPFRGAFVIAQNHPVEADRAVLERIMSVHFDKTGWSDETKAAARRIANVKIDDVSGFVVHAARREREVMDLLRERVPHHEGALLALPGVSDDRLALNHAQLLAMVDALPIVLPGIAKEWLEPTRTFIRTMAVDRHRAVSSDHQHVETFWDRYHRLEELAQPNTPINHSRDPENVIAVRLTEFEERCAERKLQHAPIGELRKLLRSSKRYPFVEAKSVNSITGAIVHCFVFQRKADAKAARGKA